MVSTNMLQKLIKTGYSVYFYSLLTSTCIHCFHFILLPTAKPKITATQALHARQHI